MASNPNNVAEFNLFPSDRDLLDSIELYRTFLIESNPHGAEHELFLRGTSIGVLVKMMAKSTVVDGGMYSKESLADGIELTRLENSRRSKGGNAA